MTQARSWPGSVTASPRLDSRCGTAAAASIESDRGNDAEDTAYGRRATPQ